MNTALHDELLRMRDEDQHMRNTLIAKYPPGTLRKAADADWWLEVDRRNTARMKQIIAEHGWPTISLVGNEASNAAWLLVQHADEDRAFQKHCLGLLEDAVARGETSAGNLAYLTDRVLIGEGKPQRYGTQMHQEGGLVRPLPTDDIEHIDAQRKAMGLESLRDYVADYAEHNGLRYSLEPAPLPVSNIVRQPDKLMPCASLPIKPGHEAAVRAWWRELATRAWRPAWGDMGLVAQSVFLDQRDGQACVLLYSRLQRSAEPPPASDEAAEHARFFAANFDLAALRTHDILFDVDRLAVITADDVRRARQPNPGSHGLPIIGQAQCQRIRIRPGILDQVRDYCTALPTRDGLGDVLRVEGVLIETMCLDRADDADYLLFYSRVENLQRSGEAFKRSTHPIDEAARAFMTETWDGAARLEMIYDVDRIADVVGDGSSHQPSEEES